MSQVSIRKVVKSYDGDVQAVKGIDLEIEDHEFVVLVGPSGCGKSTTLRMVAGLEEITDGEIWIGGDIVNDVPPRDRDIAMVFQNYALYPHMSVFDNMAFGLKLRKVPKPEIKQRVDEAARILDIGELLDRKPKALSGGQRQRVAMGRAIVRHPKVFLFDEPLSNLDAKLRVSMRAQLKHLQRELGITTVYVTHDQVEAMTLADRVVVLSQGRLQQIGTPLDIYNAPANAFVAGFVGNPPMNLIACDSDGGRLRNAAFELDLPVAARGKVTLGQRPEDLRLVAAEGADAAGEVFSAELLGDAALVTVRLGPDLVAVKADKDCGARMGDTVGLRFQRAALHVFGADGNRLPDMAGERRAP
jgi:multiple sugar transport system ATP-binding protein